MRVLRVQLQVRTSWDIFEPSQTSLDTLLNSLNEPDALSGKLKKGELYKQDVPDLTVKGRLA